MQLIKTHGFQRPETLWNFRVKDNPLSDEYKSGLQIAGSIILDNGNYVALAMDAFNIISPDGKLHKMADRDSQLFFVVLNRAGRVIHKEALGTFRGDTTTHMGVRREGDKRIRAIFGDDEYIYEVK